MANEKHTPGQWFVDKHIDTGETVIRSNDGHVIIANLEVDYSESYNKKEKPEVIEANAALIAAAPAMYEALEDVRAVLLHFMEAPDWSEEFDNAYIKLREALAAANPETEK